jgi:hypothetical protein
MDAADDNVLDPVEGDDRERIPAEKENAEERQQVGDD